MSRDVAAPRQRREKPLDHAGAPNRGVRSSSRANATDSTVEFSESRTGKNDNVSSFQYECPLWGGVGRVDWKSTGDGSRSPLFVNEANGGYRDHLCDLAEAAGAPTTAALIEDPARWLEPYMIGTARQRDGEPEALPSLDRLETCRDVLARDGDAMRYLLGERGLSEHTIRTAGVGYSKRPGFGVWPDYAAFTLPVYDDAGQLVNVRRRFWPKTPTNAKGKPVKMAGLRSRPAALYPGDPGRRWVLVCEGEFDALILRQHGFPAVTSTASTSWEPSWDGVVHRKKVVVMYDAGADSLDKARRRAEGFEAAGAARAVPVDLSVAGMGHGEDATDWFVKYGRSADDLRDLIRDAGRSA